MTGLWHSIRQSARVAYVVLTAGPRHLDAIPARDYRGAWAPLMLLSLGYGLMLMLAWAVAWDLFVRDYWPDAKSMPPMVAAAVFLLWPFRSAVLAMVNVLSGQEPGWRSLLLSLAVVCLAMCFMALKVDAHRSEDALPGLLAWLRPAGVGKMYRVLLLMPLWGAASMLITPQFCPPRQGTEPAISALAGGCGPVNAVACMALPAAGTLFYFQYLGLWAGPKIVAWSIGGAILGGIICCRRAGGLEHRALLAANFIAQSVFLLAFLANG